MYESSVPFSDAQARRPKAAKAPHIPPEAINDLAMVPTVGARWPASTLRLFVYLQELGASADFVPIVIAQIARAIHVTRPTVYRAAQRLDELHRLDRRVVHGALQWRLNIYPLTAQATDEGRRS